MSIDSGGPAFPTSHEEEIMDGNYPKGIRTERYFEGGMSLRDYYAGKAMEALIVGPHATNADAVDNPDKCAEWAYVQADSMITVKRKTEKGDDK